MTIQTTAPAPAVAGPAGTLAIEAHDLVKTYPKEVRALDGLSFAVPAGTVFALLGPNGAGKSTTIKILTTLAQADSGTAVVAGLDVRAKPARVRHLIGVVAQLSGADPVATGRENVLLTGRIQGLRGRDLARRTDELLGRFGLADAAGRRVRTYSGGMRRRLDVAMGLINRPQVLFLDEPTSGLDPVATREVHELIAALKNRGVTIFLTTHRLEEAERLCHRVAILSTTLRLIGRPDELREQLFTRSLEVRTRAALDDPGNVFAGLAGVEGWEQVPSGSYQLTVADPDAVAPGVARALVDAGVDILSIAESHHSLEDVYLELIDDDVEAPT
jgi:ABC-2 type transport system ATP-binding protein